MSKNTPKTHTIQSTTINTSTIVQDIILSPLSLLLGLLGILVVVANWKPKKKTNILARGAMATDDHLENARLKALGLIEAQKFNDVGCYLGTPKGTQLIRANGEAAIIVGEDRDRVYLEATGGSYFQGINGSGKSFSGLLPQVRSFMDQGCGSKKGIPISFFDIKFSTHSKKQPSPSAEIAGYAKARGYRVHVFAPGVSRKFIPSWARPCTINLLDFVRDAEDVEMARQVVLVLLKNLVMGFEKMNPFFRDACVSGLQGLILVAKRTNKPDLLTCRQLLNHPNLILIINSPLLSESVKMVFDTFRKAMAVPETFSGIESTISNALGTILMPAIAPDICGETTVPLDLDGNDLLIFGVDGERRDVVCPIIAATIHLHVNRNLLRPRETPYILSLDEFGSIYLPDLDEWPNQLRSAGLILQLATQSPEVQQKRYGKDGASRIIKGCANHLIFQSDYEDAKNYAAMTGQSDVVYDSVGSSTNPNGGSSSKSEQRSKIDLLEAHELVQAPKGKALVITRSTGDKTKTRVPFFKQIEIPQWDCDAVAESVQKWNGGLTRPDIDTRFSNSDFAMRTDCINEFFGPFDEPEKAELKDSVDHEEEAISLALAFFN